MTNGREVFCLALLGSVSAPCMAQNTDPGGVANVKIVDRNGINVLTKLFEFDHIDVAIGSGKGRLEFHRSNLVNAGENNFNSFVYYDESNDVTNVVVNSTSTRFTVDGGNTDGNGASFTNDGTYPVFVDRNGARYTFSARDDPYTRPAKIVYPDGRQLTLTWKNYSSCSTEDPTVCETVGRISSINNESGYQLKFEYKSDDPFDMNQDYADNSYIPPMLDISRVTALNNAVEYCDPTADHCTFSHSWAHSDYARTQYGYVATHADGQSDSYTVEGSAAYPSKIYELSNSPGAYKRVITYQYLNTDYGVTSISIAGKTTLYNYAITFPAPYTTQYVITATDALSHTNQYVTSESYPTSPRLNSATDGNGHVTSYQYDSYGHVTRVTVPEQNYIQLDYDGRGNVVTQTFVAKPASGLSSISVYSGFDASCSNIATCNQPNWTKDANGNQTDYTYDATSGQILTATLPAVGGVRPQTRYNYISQQAYFKNSSGSIVASGIPVSVASYTSSCRTLTSCAGTSDETRATLIYGPQAAGTANNLLPVGQYTAAGDGSLNFGYNYGYDDNGNRITSADYLGTTVSHYDAMQQVVGVVGPDPDGGGPRKNRAQRLTYNVDGAVTLAEKGTVLSQSDPDWANFVSLQSSATVYDDAGRKVQQSVRAGGNTYAVSQNSYDDAGRLQCTALRMNDGAFAPPLPAACTAGTAGSLGPDRITLNSYDNADQLLKVTTGYGVTGQQRDDQTLTYSNNGKVKTIADANGNLTTYVLDGFDRLSQTQYPSPSTPGSSNAADYEQLGYDPGANVTSRRLRDGTTIGYGYDALNRLATKTLPGGEPSVTYSYDNFSHPLTIAGATSITNSWDALGHKTGEVQPFGSVAYQYDGAGRRTRLTWQDGMYLGYGYDAVDELTSIVENNGTINLATFSYDDLGQRTTRTAGNGLQTTYGYDPISRLTSIASAGSNATTVTIGNYSPSSQIGSRTNSNDAYSWRQLFNTDRTYTPNGLNQYANIGGRITPTYDAKGNLTSAGTITYAYTAENMLKSASPGATLSYDPAGRLQEYDAPAATRFAYDGGTISEELNSGGTVLRRYVFGPGGDEPLVWYEGSGTADRRYLDQDERGTVTRITRQDGSTFAINTYDEYGNAGSGNQGRFGYTGQAWLPEIGLAYYKARMYSPSLGRFLQTDPIGYDSGMNWYNYVDSDPVNGSDMWGLQQQQLPVFNSSNTLNYTSHSTGASAFSSPFGGGGAGTNAGLDARQMDIAQQQLHDSASSRLRTPQNPQPNNHGCGRHSDLADAALYVFNFAGNAADAASLGLAGASAEAGGPSNPVGASLAVGALVANRVSAGFSGIQIPINLFQGNYRGALANGVGLLAGHFAATLTNKALGTSINGLKKDAINSGAGQVASNASGC